MYAQTADVVSVLGRQCVIVAYDDDAMTYLVWSQEAQEYLVVAQDDVWNVERYSWGRVEELTL